MVLTDGNTTYKCKVCEAHLPKGATSRVCDECSLECTGCGKTGQALYHLEDGLECYTCCSDPQAASIVRLDLDEAQG